MVHHTRVILAFVLLLGLTMTPRVQAQTGTSRISGTVSDETGAVIPGVEITATHTATGIARNSITNDSGYYTIEALPVGYYEIRAQRPGFKIFLQKGVILEAEAKVTLNLMLEVGEISESVTITGTPPPIQAESSEISTLVSGLQLSELALNGRNFSQLLSLGPGVVSRQSGHLMGLGQEGNPLLSIHGGGTNNNKFTYDGTLAMDTGGNRGLDLFPPMEAIQEVKIMKSNYSADMGSYGYGLINIVTKAGGREFHGDIYEYLRNDALDARNFFASAASPLKLNNFGYTLGGPVYIPGKYNQEKNKIFFFWSHSWSIRRGPQLVSAVDPPSATFTALTPSPAMRRGDFSEILPQRIRDPVTGQPFPNNLIPPERIDPNARFLLERYYPLPNRSGLPNFVTTPSSATEWREELLRLDHHFSDKVSLMGRYGQDKWEQDQAVIKPAPQAFPTIGGFFAKPGKNFTGKLTTIFNSSTIHEFTFGFSMNRATTIPAAAGRRPVELTIPEVFPANRNHVIPNVTLAQGFGAIGVGNQFNSVNPVFTYKDDFSRLVKNHHLKLGFEILRLQKFTVVGTDLQGSFSFNGSATGQAVADLLLGEAASYTEVEQREKAYVFGHNWEFYVHDDWKLKPDFTLNAGLRYYILAGAPQSTEKFNRISTFVPQLYDPVRAPRIIPSSGELVPDTGDPLNGIITPDDRKGLDLSRSLVKTHFDTFGPRIGFAWSPFGNQKTILRGGYGMFYFWGNNNHETLVANPPFSRSVSIFNTKLSNPTAGRGASFPPSLFSFDTNYLIPTVQHWSLNLQRQIVPETVLSVAYVGTRGTHLEQNINTNQPRPTLDVAQRRISANAVRPFRGYADISFAERSASSIYHGLEVHLLRRLHQGLMFEVAYTYSKAIEWAVGQDALLHKNEKALSDLDRTHVFVINYVYQLPFYNSHRGMLGKLLGGWQMSGITTFQSGLPFTVTVSGDRAGVGGGTQRPNPIGTPNQNRPKRIERFFDTSAFVLNPLGRFGTAGRNIIRGPGINDWSMSFFKNTSIRWFKAEGATMQLGAEFFNIFNHPQFETVGAVFGSANFGRVLSALDPRIVQFRLKISY
ncbi:MAG: carboxypeptidase regulatory-like domain-containing protein [Acidobacteria bacterium]|nr:carboxypeptidase regulatory-like domain-containing protein [Acidobacteriota bacterium]